MTQIAPIIATLRRHKISAFLIGMEIALACAVLCNACFMVVSRMQSMRVNSGVDESSLAVVTLTGFDPAQASDLNARMLDGLRRIPGVQSAAVVNAVPFGQSAGNAGIRLEPDGKHRAAVPHFYVGSPGAMEALGVKLIEGRRFAADDFHPVNSFVPDSPASVMVTRSLADHLWPDGKALGKMFYCDRLSFRVIGVVERLARPTAGEEGPQSFDWSILTAGTPGAKFAGIYLLRADPAHCRACCARRRMPWRRWRRMPCSTRKTASRSVICGRPSFARTGPWPASWSASSSAC